MKTLTALLAAGTIAPPGQDIAGIIPGADASM